MSKSVVTKKTEFAIFDCTGAFIAEHGTFNTAAAAEDYLKEFLGADYDDEESRQQYCIEKCRMA